MTDENPNPEELQHQVEQLEAEVKVLKEENLRTKTGGTFRRTMASLLVLLTCLSFFVASVSYWANRNLLNTTVWTERVAPLAKDPAVQAAITDQVTTDVMKIVKPEKLLNEALPERGKILAVPLTSAFTDFVHGKVADFLKTDTFQNLWTQAVTTAHEQAVMILNDEIPTVTAGNKSVVINVLPIIDEVLAKLSKQTPELFGKSIKIPKVSTNDLPQSARQKIAAAFGVPLSKNFGTFTVYDEGKLKAAQDGLKLFNQIFMVSVILTLLLIPTSLFVSHRRRRTGLQLLIGFSLGVIILRRVAIRTENDVTSLVSEKYQDAVHAVVSAFTHPFLNNTAKILWLFGIAILILVMTANYGWVVRLRAKLAALGRAIVNGVSQQTKDERNIEWITRNRVSIQIGLGVLQALMLLFVDLSWLGFFTLLVVVGGLELLSARITGTSISDIGREVEPQPQP